MASNIPTDVVFTTEQKKKIQYADMMKAHWSKELSVAHVETHEVDQKIAMEKYLHQVNIKRLKKIELLNLKADNSDMQKKVADAFADLCIKTGEVIDLETLDGEERR